MAAAAARKVDGRMRIAVALVLVLLQVVIGAVSADAGAQLDVPAPAPAGGLLPESALDAAAKAEAERLLLELGKHDLFLPLMDAVEPKPIEGAQKLAPVSLDAIDFSPPAENHGRMDITVGQAVFKGKAARLPTKSVAKENKQVAKEADAATVNGQMVDSSQSDDKVICPSDQPGGDNSQAVEPLTAQHDDMNVSEAISNSTFVNATQEVAVLHQVSAAVEASRIPNNNATSSGLDTKDVFVNVANETEKATEIAASTNAITTKDDHVEIRSSIEIDGVDVCLAEESAPHNGSFKAEVISSAVINNVEGVALDLRDLVTAVASEPPSQEIALNNVGEHPDHALSIEQLDPLHSARDPTRDQLAEENLSQPHADADTVEDGTANRSQVVSPSTLEQSEPTLRNSTEMELEASTLMSDIVGHDRGQLGEVASDTETDLPATLSDLFSTIPVSSDDREQTDEEQAGTSVVHSNEFEVQELVHLLPSTLEQPELTLKNSTAKELDVSTEGVSIPMPDIVGYDHDQLEEARSNPETEVPAPFSNVFENVPLTVDERERKDEGKPGNSIDHSNEFEGLDLEAIPPYSRNEEQAKDLSNAIELDRVDAHDEELHDSSNEIKKGVILEEQVSRDTSEAFDASALPPRLTKKLFRGLRALVPDDYHAKLHDLEIASIRVLDELSGWSREVDAEVRDGRVVLFLWLGEVWSKTVEQAQVARDTAKQIWRTNEDLRIVCRNVAGLIALLLSGAAFATCYLVVSWIPSFLLNFYRGFDVVTRAQLQIFSCLIVLLLLYRVRALLMFWVVAALSAAYYYWSGHVVIEVRFT